MTRALYFPEYTIGDASVFLTPRRVGGYDTAPAQVVGSGSIASEGFVSGSTGWIIRGDGSFELDGGTFRGDLQSENFVLDTSGWFLDYDTGSAQFNGSVVARDLTTGLSGDVRVYITDSGVLGGSFAGVYFDTGDADQDTGAVLYGAVQGSGGTEYHQAALVGFVAYDNAHSPPALFFDTESSDGSTSGQRIIARVDANGSQEGGFDLQDETGPGNGSSYYGFLYSASQTYMLLSTSVDFWNFQYVRVNTGSDLVVVDGKIFLGTAASNDYIEHSGTTLGVYNSGALGYMAASRYYFDAVAGNDYLLFDDTNNLLKIIADSSLGYMAAARYYFSEGGNDYITFDDTSDYFSFYADATEFLRIYEGYGAAGRGRIYANSELYLGAAGTTRFLHGTTQIFRFDVNASKSRIVVSGTSANGVSIVSDDGVVDLYAPGLYGTSTAYNDARHYTGDGRIYYQTSTEKVKTGIREADIFELGDVMAVQPRRFFPDKKMLPDEDDTIEQTGFVAEELAVVNPEFATYGPVPFTKTDPHGNIRLVYKNPEGEEFSRKV
jgi:hypothetical protein